ncbi:MAG: hypothetical protein HY925_12255 [Elusimicrobia bacterium]|nr:hypothetical protein [Elusimicrobiota bacterium]
MKGRHKVQYTIRDIPPNVDEAVRDRARRRGQSLNQAVVEMLSQEAAQGSARLYHDLDGFFGSWTADREVDRALAEQRRIDPKLWK